MNEKSYQRQLAELRVAQLTPTARQYLWQEEAKKMAQALERDTLDLNISSANELWNLVEAWVYENAAFLGARIEFTQPPIKESPVFLTFVVGKAASCWWQVDVWVDVYNINIC